MRIERVTMFQVRMSLLAPFETSFGVEHDRECIIVRLDGEGVTGWGECVASLGPWYSYETITTAWHILADFLIPAVLGKDLSGPEEVAERLGRVRGHPMAKAGLEMAAWDLAAMQANVSLASLLGGTRDRVAVGVSIGIQPTLEQLLARVEEYVAQGYARVKIKIKPGWDVDSHQGGSGRLSRPAPAGRCELGLSSAGCGDLPTDRRPQPAADRAAARPRRHLRSCQAAGSTPNADLPG